MDLAPLVGGGGGALLKETQKALLGVAVNERTGKALAPAPANPAPQLTPAPAGRPAPAGPATAGPCTSWPLQWLRAFPSNDFPPVQSLYYAAANLSPRIIPPASPVALCVTLLVNRHFVALCNGAERPDRPPAVGTNVIAHHVLQPNMVPEIHTPRHDCACCASSHAVHWCCACCASSHGVRQQRPPPSTSSTAAGGGVGDGGARRGQCSRAITRAVDQRRGIPRG